MLLGSTAIIESRPWLPRYKATVLSEHGSIIATKLFWRLGSARSWAYEFSYRKYAPNA